MPTYGVHLYSKRNYPSVIRSQTFADESLIYLLEHSLGKIHSTLMLCVKQIMHTKYFKYLSTNFWSLHCTVPKDKWQLTKRFFLNNPRWLFKQVFVKLTYLGMHQSPSTLNSLDQMICELVNLKICYFLGL